MHFPARVLRDGAMITRPSQTKNTASGVSCLAGVERAPAISAGDLCALRKRLANYRRISFLFLDIMFSFTVFPLLFLSIGSSNLPYPLPNKKHRFGCFLFGRGRKIRTFGMTESESVALPLGDTP